MKDFWQNPKVKNYLVCDLFDVDEVVRIYGGCPNDEDYKIIRTYYYWEWQGNQDWEAISCTKEDYEKYKYSDEEDYRTELNYKDFEDKFWFEEFVDFLIQVEFDLQNDFASFFTETFDNITFEGKAKLFLRNTIQGLIKTNDTLLSLNKKFEINKIQKGVINHYSNSYINIKKRIVKKFELIYPELLKEFIDVVGETSPKKEPYWKPIARLIFDGKIKIVKENERKFYFENTEFINISKLGNHLAKILNGKENTIRTILTDSYSNSGQKNIFVKQNLLFLKTLNDSNISIVFKEHFTELNKNNN